MKAQAGSGETRRIVVFERQPYWEPELRRQFDDEGVSVQACRTLTDLEHMTVDTTGCVVVAALADGPADLLRWLSQRLIGGRSLPVVVVTNPITAALRWHASEAGATAVVGEDFGGEHLARLCRKQWAVSPTDRDPQTSSRKTS